MIAGFLVRIVAGRFEMFRVLMWSRCGRGHDLSLGTTHVSARPWTPISRNRTGDTTGSLSQTSCSSTQRFFRQGIAGSVFFGNPGDLPLAGDWDGDGDHDIAVFRPSEARFYLRDDDTGVVTPIWYGDLGDMPLAGNWDGGGTDIGVYRPSNQKFYLRMSNGSTTEFFYGNPGDIPVIGNWDGLGTPIDSPGVIR